MSLPKSHSEDLKALIQSGYRYAYSLTHHRQNAEDLIQQACLKVIRTKGGLESRQYLFQAIRNLFLDSLRSKSNSVVCIENIEQLPSTGDSHEEQKNQQWEVEQLLRVLPVEQREVLYLNLVERYSASEISQLINKPRNTVLSHLARAKKRLKNHQQAMMKGES